MEIDAKDIQTHTVKSEGHKEQTDEAELFQKKDFLFPQQEFQSCILKRSHCLFETCHETCI